MDTIKVTLPEGQVEQIPKGTTPLEVVRKLDARLAEQVVVAKTNGDLIDLDRPLTEDTSLRFLTPEDEEGQYVFRHSSAHLLAAAVIELFPDVKLGVGPPTDQGFFYEFLRDRPFTPEDLEKIEKKMEELRDANIPNLRKVLPRAEAMRLYKEQKQEFKCELVTEKAEGNQVSFYTTGKFIDFCLGPHIPSTGRIKAFKLLNVSGAYWKGIEAPPSPPRLSWTSSSTAWRKRGGATTDGSVRNSTSSASRRRAAPGSPSGTPRAAACALSWRTGCDRSYRPADTRWSTPRTPCG
jgi:threonyl-tRNA synthetase